MKTYIYNTLNYSYSSLHIRKCNFNSMRCAGYTYLNNFIINPFPSCIVFINLFPVLNTEETKENIITEYENTKSSALFNFTFILHTILLQSIKIQK